MFRRTSSCFEYTQSLFLKNLRLIYDFIVGSSRHRSEDSSLKADFSSKGLAAPVIFTGEGSRILLNFGANAGSFKG